MTSFARWSSASKQPRLKASSRKNVNFRGRKGKEEEEKKNLEENCTRLKPAVPAAGCGAPARGRTLGNE